MTGHPKNKIIALLLCALLFSPAAYGQYLWNMRNMEQARTNPGQFEYRDALSALIRNAERSLSHGPYSVTFKEKLAASGDKHDYLSQARYFWPDPDKPDGKPYVNRDGVTNPEIEKLDRNPLGNMASDVVTLSLAWYFTGDDKYAEKAAALIRTWFLDPSTLMNPNLNYAQVVPGQNGDKGRCYGLIDAYSFVEMLDGIALLEASDSFTAEDSEKLRQWFTEFLDWMLTSELGQEESRQSNNHALAYDVQVVAYALYTGRDEIARQFIESFPEKRLYAQIAPDGSQPHELRRTLAFGYSEYNIRHMIDMFAFATAMGYDIHRSESPDGRSFYKAVDFLTPYLGRDVSEWPYKQISGWSGKQQELCEDLLRIYILDPERTDYLALASRYGRRGTRDRTLLTHGTTGMSALVFDRARTQFEYALGCIEEVLESGKYEGKEVVVPRSVDKDGTLRMISARDWCSGFFPGSMWYMYDFTGDPRFLGLAGKYTRMVESEKQDRSSHDVGFKINNSFGNGYRLTGEEYYRDVMIEAAGTLIERFDDNVGSIRSWSFNRDRWKFPVIIDNMMNLELLFTVTQFTGDSTYYRIADTHARTTLREHFRSDNSSYHVVDYDPGTGNVRMKVTHQGYSDPSAWARGQAWGLYGYTMCYRYTRDPEYLAQAERIAAFIFGHPNLPDDLVPYWDFNAPDIPDAPRDASAASITASALYELSGYAGDGYRLLADRILRSLVRNYLADTGTSKGFLLLHSTGHLPGGDEIDVPISYADYYFLEAMSRKHRLDTGN